MLIIHSFHGKSVNIHYDSDILSGECIIVNKESGEEIRVSGGDLLDFVAKYVKDKRISELEISNTAKILGI